MCRIKSYKPLEIKLINFDPKIKMTGNLLFNLKSKNQNKNFNKYQNAKMTETLTILINLNNKSKKIDSLHE